MFPKPDIIVVVIVGNIIIGSDSVLPNDNLWHNISRKNWIKNGNNIKIRLKKNLNRKMEQDKSAKEYFYRDGICISIFNTMSCCHHLTQSIILIHRQLILTSYSFLLILIHWHLILISYSFLFILSILQSSINHRISTATVMIVVTN